MAPCASELGWKTVLLEHSVPQTERAAPAHGASIFGLLSELAGLTENVPRALVAAVGTSAMRNTARGEAEVRCGKRILW